MKFVKKMGCIDNPNVWIKLNPLLFIFITILVLESCRYDKVELPPPPPPINSCDTLNATYSGAVASIINGNCNISGCHDSGSAFGDYTNYEGVKEKIDNGTFKTRVMDQKDMPPSNPLPKADLDKLKCWLEAGAPNN